MSRVYSKTPSGGDIASSVTNKVILASQRCAVAAAVAKARWNPPCAGCKPAVYTSTGGNTSSGLLQQQIDTNANINSMQANQIANQQLRGTTGTNYAQYLQQKTLMNYAPATDPARRFLAYQGNFIPTPCPPTPTEQLNSTLPKPRTNCQLLQVPGYLRPSA
jgi:hypothetical protein